MSVQTNPWHMIWTLARTDFKARYHGTLAGFLWALLKPVTMFAVLMWVFAVIFDSDPNYKLKLVIGLFLHDFFVDGSKTGLISLASKGFLVTRARFPVWIVVASAISNALVTVLVFSVIVLIYIGLFHGLSLTALMFPVYLALFVVIIIGISLASSVLFLRYRDLNQIWDVVTQAGFFLAPVIYPLSIIPHDYHFFLFAWPVTPVLEFSRSVLISGTLPSLTGHLYLFGVAAFFLGIGSFIYQRCVAGSVERI